MPTYYKLLNEDGTTPTTGFHWPMPKRGKPGEWLPPIIGELGLVIIWISLFPNWQNSLSAIRSEQPQILVVPFLDNANGTHIANNTFISVSD